MNMEFFDKAAGYLPDECFSRPVDLGILLGSGWGESLKLDNTIVRIPYADIPGLGASTVKGHAGEFVFCERAGKRIAVWCGRRHFYEGAGWEPVVLPIEILRRMGAAAVLLTNASGGINPHREEWGERFPDMTEVYNRRLAELLHASANRLSLRAMDGVYAYAPGPCYETPAEINAYKTWGADVVGMSTVPEAVFANACGMKVAGLSLVANLAAGISRRPLDHEEVIRASNAAKASMSALLDDFIQRL